ncbi:MAG: ankyrin repeat domain-containing protein [Epsilonproteobacteria bacterium]|nr:ankyrin repeat domain-containing protein [Campylobacterota bacterium]
MPVRIVIMIGLVTSFLFGLGKKVPQVAPSSQYRLNLFEHIKIDPEEVVLEHFKHLPPEALQERDSQGRTPLHYAVLYKKYRLLRFLVEKVDVAAQDNAGDTPVHIAARNHDFYALRVLRLSPSFALAVTLTNAREMTPEMILAQNVADTNTTKEHQKNESDENVSDFYTLEYKPMVKTPFLRYKSLNEPLEPSRVESDLHSLSDLHRAKNSGNIDIQVGGN